MTPEYQVQEQKKLEREREKKAEERAWKRDGARRKSLDDMIVKILQDEKFISAVKKRGGLGIFMNCVSCGSIFDPYQEYYWQLCFNKHGILVYSPNNNINNPTPVKVSNGLPKVFNQIFSNYVTRRKEYLLDEYEGEMFQERIEKIINGAEAIDENEPYNVPSGCSYLVDKEFKAKCDRFTSNK